MSTEEEVAKLLKINADDLETRLAEEISLHFGIQISGDVKSRQEALSRSIARLKDKVSSHIKENKSHLSRLICNELEYCKKKENEEIRVLTTIVDAGVMAVTALPLPVATIAVYAAKKGMLDHLCEC